MEINYGPSTISEFADKVNELMPVIMREYVKNQGRRVLQAEDNDAAILCNGTFESPGRDEDDRSREVRKCHDRCHDRNSGPARPGWLPSKDR